MSLMLESLHKKMPTISLLYGDDFLKQFVCSIDSKKLCLLTVIFVNRNLSLTFFELVDHHLCKSTTIDWTFWETNKDGEIFP